MGLIKPEERLSLLQQHDITRPEWSVLALIGAWPIPYDKVCRTAASHSEGDPKGSVTESDCERALGACITKGWLIITDISWLEEIHSYVRNNKLIGPVYGYPNIGEVDFTPNGAVLFQTLERLLFGEEWASLFGYEVELADGQYRYFFQKRKGVLDAIRKWKSDASVLSISNIKPIGSWCVYWWKQFPYGYCVDVDQCSDGGKKKEKGEKGDIVEKKGEKKGKKGT